MSKMGQRSFVPDRESTGIGILDEVIGGGFIRPSITALIGAPGVGTTSFCKKFILSSLSRGRRVVMACADESPPQFMRNFDSVESFDLKSHIEAKRIFFVDSYDAFVRALGIKDYSDIGSLDGASLEKTLNEARNSIPELLEPRAKDLNVVLDSVTALSPFIGIRDVHKAMTSAQEIARSGNYVMVFTAHEGALEGNLVQVLREYVDSVIRMRTRWVRGELKRDMVIEKMRFTEIKRPVLGYKITNDGIEIAEE